MNNSQRMKIICLAGVTAAASLYAGNVTESADIMLYPTFENMGVEVRHKGDANFNASGEVSYRAKGQSGWKQGHPLVLVGDTMVDPKTGATTNPRFYTSLFCLREGTAYEVKVELKDPDGVGKQPEVVTATTLDSKVPTGSGKHHYADPAAAAGGDGSKAKPFNTLEAVLKDAGPGDLRFTPAAAAPLIDAGEIVKGINDAGPDAWQYKGKAPDIGPVEAGEALPHYGPRSAVQRTK